MTTQPFADEIVLSDKRRAVVAEVLGPEQPSPVFERLHALVRRGYVANIGTDADTDTVVLRHLGKAPDLVLHGDGVVEGFEGRRPVTSVPSTRHRASAPTAMPNTSGS